MKNIFTAICTMLAGYLVGKALFNFLVTKPTSTSSEVVKLDAKTFPNVIICGDPALHYGLRPVVIWKLRNYDFGSHFLKPELFQMKIFGCFLLSSFTFNLYLGTS